MQNRSACQGDRQCQAASDRFGQDLPKQDHQNREADREQSQSSIARVHLFREHPGGVATEHQAPEDVEAVVGDRQHRQSPTQTQPQLGQPACSGYRFRPGCKFMHAHRIHGEQRCFHSGAEGGSGQHHHHQHEKDQQVGGHARAL